MSLQVDRDGTFRAEIIGYGIKEMDSGAVSIAVQVQLLEWWGADQGGDPQWFDFAANNMEAEGDFWIVSGRDKGNKVNEHAAKTLMENAGWDGVFDSIQNKTWEPTRCQVVVKSEVYNGQSRRKIAFLNDWNKTPGSNLSNVTPDKVKELSARFGSQFRALAGTVKRNGPPPAGGPTPPPPAHGMAPPPPVGGDIPF